MGERSSCRQGTHLKQGGIYMVSLDPTVGREQFGHRPVLVVSPDRFNEITKLPIVVPITNGGGFAVKIGFGIPLQGTKTTGLARCDQPRTCDVLERGGRFVEFVPDAVLTPVLDLVRSVFNR
ncbi:MAG: type II toxin-antitoxin system PemK/MazF family toxin [Terriglobus sp.]